MEVRLGMASEEEDKVHRGERTIGGSREVLREMMPIRDRMAGSDREMKILLLRAMVLRGDRAAELDFAEWPNLEIAEESVTQPRNSTLLFYYNHSLI